MTSTVEKIAETKPKAAIRPERKKMVRARAPSGGVSYRSDDEVAEALAGLSEEDVVSVVSAVVDTPTPDLRARYAHLGKGHRRMCLGNLIRGAISRATKQGPEEAQAVIRRIQDEAAKRKPAPAQGHE